MPELAPGLHYWPGYLDRDAQAALVEALRRGFAQAPPFVPRMPRSDTPFSVRMSNCGPFGWVSDKSGYRYQEHHPETGRPWPPIPALALEAWRSLAAYPHPPQACLVNVYDAKAKMGLHQDRDEADLAAPVLSLSLGDTALFRWGGTQRQAPTRSIRLQSGDALVLGGPARLVFHGVDRIHGGSSTLLPGGGRINLTLRRVTAPDAGPAPE
jgi:alkylated DNA repair protein (DNA oxidative demethylase)